MVLPAVLRDPALDSEQAARRDGPVRLDRDSRLPALARHLAGALGDLPAAVPAVLLDLRHRVHRPRLAGIEARRGRLRDRIAGADRVVLPPLHRGAAAAWPAR